MRAVDLGLLLAVVTLGWGISLATYRKLAQQFDWPMGTWHIERPELPVLIGSVCIFVAVLFALARAYGGHALSALSIPVLGLAWAAFWTGFLRAGAQSALLLGPAATLFLILLWLG
jgi:hypothetical protein